MTLFPQDIVSDRNGINTVGLMVALVLFVAVAGIATSFHNRYNPSPVVAAVAPARPVMPVASMHSQRVSAQQSETPIAETAAQEVNEEPVQKATVAAKPAKEITPRRETAKTETKTEAKKLTQEESAAIRRERKEAARKSTEISVSAGPGADVTSLVSADDFAKDRTIPSLPPQGVEKVTAREIGNQAINWYSVRLGFTDSEVRANVLRDVLAAQGYPEARTIKSGDGTFHVNAGDFRFKSQAEKLSKELEDKTGIPSKIYEKTVAE